MSIHIPRIGVIGGGQLGQMLILAGKPLGFRFAVLDPDPQAPAAGLADAFIAGDLYDSDALDRLVNEADVTTFEIEHANTQVLEKLHSKGHQIHPAPALLAMVNDKFVQKSTFRETGVPVPRFWPERPAQLPVVQKLRHGGYDGRGVVFLRQPDDPELEGQSFYEECVDIKAEFAVIVARSVGGESVAYPAIDLEFDTRANIQSRASLPSELPPQVQQRGRDIAIQAVESIGSTGVVAVELFWATNGDVLLNEIAPRPHNSGHLTIEACETNQFEQHLRAISGLPLGSVDIRCPAVSLNLLGADGSRGRPALDSIAEIAATPGAHVHWYNKSAVRPFRKMGHVTITGSSLADAAQKSEQLQSHCWVGGTE